MLHGVVSLSDICTADGTRLDNVFLSRAQFGGSRNDFLWSDKHHVSPADYTTWSKAIEFIFVGTNQKLTTPLGPWLVDCDRQWLGEWDGFVTFDRESLYFRASDTEWYQYSRQGRSHQAYAHQRNGLPAAPVVDVSQSNSHLGRKCNHP